MHNFTFRKRLGAGVNWQGEGVYRWDDEERVWTCAMLAPEGFVPDITETPDGSYRYLTASDLDQPEGE